MKIIEMSARAIVFVRNFSSITTCNRKLLNTAEVRRSKLFVSTVSDGAQDYQNIATEEGSKSSFRTKCERKVLKVALVGRPNAGKSTLINQIVGRVLCPVSMKAHTTRVKLRAYVNEGDTQLVFLDTPGLVFAEEVKKFKFDPTFLRSAEEAVQEADIIGVIHDASNSRKSSLDPCITRLLLLYQQKKSFLVLNKIDAAKQKRALLNLTTALTRQPKSLTLDPNKVTEADIAKQSKTLSSWPYFHDVFMISALEGDGVGDVKEYLLQEAYPGKWLVTKEPTGSKHSLAVDFVKAACLDFLPEEVPYKLKFSLEYFENSDGIFAVEVAVHPSNRRHQRMVFDKIRSIAGYAESQLASAMGAECRLRVQVKLVDEESRLLQ